MPNEMIEYTFDEVEAETDLAWLIVMGDWKDWLPKSKCDIDLTNMIIEVPEWLATEKELE